MDVRASVDLLIQRIKGGASIDDAAQGLDLGWDHYGNHATCFLCVPGTWGSLDQPKLLELVDWFLDHGADGAYLLEKTLSDISYAGVEENPIRAHLLAKPSPPDLGRALVRAFCLRRLSLSRAFLARGADPSVLRDWVEPDLVTPAKVDVQYQASAEAQLVTLRITLRRLQPDYPAAAPACELVPRALVRLGASHLLGGCVFEPRSSHVIEESIETVESKLSTDVELKLRVRGVAPAGLALVFRSWVGRNLHWYPSAISLTGSLDTQGDSLAVDSARARSWFGDVSIDSLVTPESLPFSVSAKPRKRMFAVVEHREGLSREVHALTQVLDPELLQAPSVGFDVENQTAYAHFDSKGTPTKAEIVLKQYGAGAALDAAPLRAALLHGLAALDGVTHVRWCDDAGAVEATGAGDEAPPAKPAKTKRVKPVAVDHPDRGVSRIAALRARLGNAELPWRERGAPSQAIPSQLGNELMPPTLREWLEAGDATWPLAADRPLAPRTFAELMAESQPELAEMLAPLGDGLLAGGCLPLFVPTSCADGTVLFLHFPLSDADGEPPVLGIDPTDEGLVGVYAPRFDHYVERVFDKARTPTFSAGPLSDPYLKALVARLPARLRSRARPHQGVIAIGSLLAS